MANSRTVITANPGIWAAPDHNHTRFYVFNEQHAIGDPLMPQGLSTALVGLGKAAEDNGAIAPDHVNQRKVDKVKLLDHDGPQPLPW